MKDSNTKTAAKKATPAKSSSTSKNGATTKKSADSKTTSPKGTVKPKASAAEGLRDLFVDSLKDIYWAEKALVKALPKMAKNATSQNLIDAINDHLEVTKGQVSRLEEVFASVGEKAVAKKCDAMEGLLAEASGIIEDTDAGTMIRDAGLILAAQKVEHYEIATYGTLRTFAETMGHTDVAELLAQTLENEKATDVALTEAAVASINQEAAAE